MGFKGSFEVYPSQNYLEDRPRGFARSLYCLGTAQPKGESGVRVMGQAAIRDQKVANALRTFDTWYPTFSEVKRPIAIEPNGANLEAQTFYRPVSSSASAFRLMGRLNEIEAGSNDELFMLACIIRGGVYSGGKSK
jgi:CRISPR-associated protein Csy3